MLYDLNMNTPKPKLSANDWLDVALQVLAEDGLSALAVEPLAKRMGVTKGSFYWHFNNRKVLVIELLKFWENIELSYQKSIESKNSLPKDFLKEALGILIEDDTNKRVFLALSNELNDEEVKDFYHRAVARRLNIFESTYSQMGASKDQARTIAHSTYFSYLGLIKSLTDKSINSKPKKLIKSVIHSAINPNFN